MILFYIKRISAKRILPFLTLLLLLILHFLPVANANESDLKQFSGLVHVHSNYSAGKSIDELARMAQKQGIDILVLTDHDLIQMEYGVPPFRNIFKRKRDKDSIIKLSVENYLEEIRIIGDRYHDVTLIPGVESSPFYYWTGSPFNANLVSHNWRKHILVIGMENPDDYYGLPIPHNKFSTRYTYKLLFKTSFFIVAALFSLILIRWKGFYRLSGGILFSISCLAIANYHPFKSSMYDQYSGDKGTAPYQELIDYANEVNGLTFWAHPESNVTSEDHGGVTMVTPKYTQDLVNTTNYTGFEAVYEDTIRFTSAGMGWDRILKEYVEGIRDKPVWGLGGLDYHGLDDSGGVKFGNVQTVFFAKNRYKDSILSALKNGSMYAIRKSGQYRLRLDKFTAYDMKSNQTAHSGQEIKSSGRVSISLNVSYTDSESRNIVVKLIRSGKIVKVYKGSTPFSAQYNDSIKQDETMIYYRLLIKGGSPHSLTSNPVFIKMVSGE